MPLEIYESISIREELKKELSERQGPIFNALKDVRHKIAILSGKGGVGKTSTVVNMASVLRNMGNEVGIFDADVHGPSIPKLTGLNKKTDLHGAWQMKSLETDNGIKVMSVSLFWPGEATPVLWKGHYKARVIRQLLASVNWGKLDYLLVDLPPGTGDEPVTIMKSIPGLDGVVVVTTPQEVSVAVCSKAISSAIELGVPILGLVENMSAFVCPHCSKATPVLGEGKGEELARTYKIPFLGRVPLHELAGKAADEGVPVVDKYPGSPAAAAFQVCTVNLLSVLNSREEK
ncbi:Mrp/NBP35 family ATP-binding protein [Desulfofundulus thermosubterraneus]|uniref:Iron-sulfur cluster carrier protein n=1 Tax=Desulfofundulus thermosubterraneus DSM 16057 TaxID=1121432 RepID=A0A1M6EAR2_9FIRM|nr:Mrp/NBP35 family ATP-binding protein [Desulfofundulus thermosubterraneus]SHI82562.1 Chromosome partitioning ATPase, Mrp family, contains Fe-S cluster [Desulfofundulus thermosubterraneus DSM 16057]